MDYLLVVVAAILVVGACVSLFVPGPGQRLRHRITYWLFRKVWQSGRAVVNLRVVDGTQDGLNGRRWFGGSALATPGRIEFVLWVGGLPLVKKAIPPIDVTAVGAAGPVRGFAKVRLMDPDYQVALLRTTTATLEIAVVPPIPAEDVLVRLRAPGMPVI
jgi:hypothetical protein